MDRVGWVGLWSQTENEHAQDDKSGDDDPTGRELKNPRDSNVAGKAKSTPTVAVQMGVGRRRGLGDSEQNVNKFVCQLLWAGGGHPREKFPAKRGGGGHVRVSGTMGCQLLGTAIYTCQDLQVAHF